MKCIKSIALQLVVAILLPAFTTAATMIKGTVMSAGPGNLFIVAVSGEQIDFVVPSGTHITRDGQLVKLADLQARDRVSVMASEAGPERIATDISARSPY